MLRKLKNKWKVSGFQVFLILCTFAIGGSLCGYAGRKLLGMLTDLGREDALYWVLYIILITLLWPVCVLIISLPLGQYIFFRNYLARIWARMRGRK
jgi:hypothetical protein